MSQARYHLEVANTILSQLGGKRFLLMTGAKHLKVLQAPGLQFDLPSDSAFVKRNIKRIQVLLDPNDTYSMIAFKEQGKALNFVKITQQAGVYRDMLEDIFTDITGLYTRL